MLRLATGGIRVWLESSPEMKFTFLKNLCFGNGWLSIVIITTAIFPDCHFGLHEPFTLSPFSFHFFLLFFSGPPPFFFAGVVQPEGCLLVVSEDIWC